MEMLKAHWAVVVPSALSLEVEPHLISRSLPEVVDLLVGYEEWMSSGTTIETLPT